MANKFGYIFKKSRVKLTSLNIVFNSGAAYESKGTNGISHLMEHLITKAVDIYQDRFLNDCIEFNAYTTHNHVVVYFKGLESKLTPEFKQELVGKILNGFADVTPEMFETERDIVYQEILDGFEDALEGNWMNIVHGYYNVTETLGTIDDVGTFTYKDAKKLAKSFYTRPARIVEVASKPTQFKKIKYNEEVNPVAIPKFKKTIKIVKNVATGDKVCVYGFSKRIINKADYPYLVVSLSMLSDGLSSPLYQEVREKRGLTYYIGASPEMYATKGIAAIFTATTKDKADQVVEVLTKMSNNIKKYLTKERYNVIINLLKTKREIEKCMPIKNISDLIAPEDLRLPKNLDKLSFNKIIEVTEKYFGSNMLFEVR